LDGGPAGRDRGGFADQGLPAGGEHDDTAAGLDGRGMPARAEFKTELETHRPWGGWYGHYEGSPKALIVPRLLFLRWRPRVLACQA
jgi:hypothetical protein